MLQNLKRFFRSAILKSPRNQTLFQFARTYVDHYLNDNNYDYLTNGELKAMRAAVPANGAVTAFDVGANIGEWTHSILEHNPAAVVHCFEPGTTAFAQLQARNFPPQVVLNPIGMGDTRETRQFHVYSNSLLSSLYTGRVNDKGERVIDVQIDTVDQYCADHQIDQIDFLKIDVEGHDLPVLKGAARMLSEGRIAKAQFEYGRYWIYSRRFLRDVFEFAPQVNCAIYKVMPSGLRRIDEYDLELERFRDSYYILRPRGVS
ncbi:MAG: FkbM family methyltransferase [Chloroflexota bacterium]|nr:FkbM family methyltransferase [Chloroflexota bacterium]